MLNPWDPSRRRQNLDTIADLRVGDKLDVTGTDTFRRQAPGAWTSVARTFSRNKAAAYYLPIYKLFQETILAGFNENPTGAAVPWYRLKRARTGLDNLARTYAGEPDKYNDVERLTEETTRLLKLLQPDNLPLYLLRSGAPCLRFKPDLRELRALSVPGVIPMVEHDGCQVSASFLGDVGRMDISVNGARVPDGGRSLPFLLEKMDGDKVALRELSRVLHQGALMRAVSWLTAHTTADNTRQGRVRPLFWTATGYGYLLNFRGAHRVVIGCRKTGASIDRISIYLTQSTVGDGQPLLDPVTKNPEISISRTQSPLQLLRSHLWATLERRGDSFALEIDDAEFEVWCRPAIGQHTDTPD